MAGRSCADHAGLKGGSYADDFVLIVKGSKAQAEAIREECRRVLEDSLKLRQNLDNTRITHVNDGFIFLGHRIIRKRSRYGDSLFHALKSIEGVRAWEKSLGVSVLAP